MATLFISDLHLDDERPDATDLFENFIANEASHSDGLYILGDLFEYWLGDDFSTATSERVAKSLASLADRGIPVWFMQGNRDFLLQGNYAGRCGMKVLEETCVVDLYGTPTLLLHGDTLCTDDAVYQAVRAQVRNEQWQQGFLAKSIPERIAFAMDARSKSKAHQKQVSMEIMDVNAQAVESALKQNGVTEMIHGHTHRPAIHKLELNGGQARRIVLGDWYTQGSVLRVDGNGIDLAVL